MELEYGKKILNILCKQIHTYKHTLTHTRCKCEWILSSGVVEYWPQPQKPAACNTVKAAKTQFQTAATHSFIPRIVHAQQHNSKKWYKKIYFLFSNGGSVGRCFDGWMFGWLFNWWKLHECMYGWMHVCMQAWNKPNMKKKKNQKTLYRKSNNKKKYKRKQQHNNKWCTGSTYIQTCNF